MESESFWQAVHGLGRKGSVTVHMLSTQALGAELKLWTEEGRIRACYPNRYIYVLSLLDTEEIQLGYLLK